MWRMQLYRICKYGVTGVLNTGVSYVVSALLVFLGMTPHWGWAGGFFTGMGTSYLVNSIWTFRQRLSRQAATRFFGVNVMVLLVSEGSLSFILHTVSSSPYVAQAVNLFPVVVIGYILNQFIVFRESSERASVVVKHDL